MALGKVKKWHIATIVAVIAIIVLIVVLATRRGSRLEVSGVKQCPAIPLGDPGTSFTQDSNCVVTCMTTDPNANVIVSQDMSGACRSTCRDGFVKSLTTGMCTVTVRESQATVDNLKLQYMNLTDPLMKQQMSAQIEMLQKRVDAANMPRLVTPTSQQAMMPPPPPRPAVTPPRPAVTPPAITSPPMSR
jgi:hypothetical protein